MLAKLILVNKTLLVLPFQPSSTFQYSELDLWTRIDYGHSSERNHRAKFELIGAEYTTTHKKVKMSTVSNSDIISIVLVHIGQ